MPISRHPYYSSAHILHILDPKRMTSGSQQYLKHFVHKLPQVPFHLRAAPGVLQYLRVRAIKRREGEVSYLQRWGFEEGMSWEGIFGSDVSRRVV
jgi:hypothetical protein